MNNNLYEKLTPSAKKALEEIMVEFNQLIISKANSISQNNQTSDKEISLRDILEARDSLFKANFDHKRKEYNFKKIINLIYLLGATYSCAGLIFYLSQNERIYFEENPGLIMFIMGIIVMLSGLIFTLYNLNRKNAIQQKVLDIAYKDINSDLEIIKLWQTIERLGGELMQKKGISTYESRSINSILKFLANELKNENLYNDMRDLLSVRNKIIHEGFKLTNNARLHYLDKAENIIKILEDLVK